MRLLTISSTQASITSRAATARLQLELSIFNLSAILLLPRPSLDATAGSRFATAHSPLGKSARQPLLGSQVASSYNALVPPPIRVTQLLTARRNSTKHFVVVFPLIINEPRVIYTGYRCFFVLIRCRASQFDVARRCRNARRENLVRESPVWLLHDFSHFRGGYRSRCRILFFAIVSRV